MSVVSPVKVTSSISGFRLKLTALALITVFNSACDSGSAVISAPEVNPDTNTSSNSGLINPTAVEQEPVEQGPIDQEPVTTVPIDTGPIDTGPIDTGSINTGSDNSPISAEVPNGESHSSEVSNAEEQSETASNQETIEPVAIDTESAVLTGAFIDSPVANLSYSTPSGSAKTNEDGEFYYKANEKITFSIGDVIFPSITAQQVITPLDIFSATSVSDIEVTNLSRLLQTLDVDNNPDNGIVLTDETEQFGTDSPIVFTNNETFEATARAALDSAGFATPLVSSGQALTHLSNSLLERELVDVSQIASADVQFDESTNVRTLPDFDADGIADIFDWDDDGDEVADNIDAFPLNASEAFDWDDDGIGNNHDTDDDNDGVIDSEDAFPLIAAETTDTDGDGFGDKLDTDDDNDGVPDIFDAFPLDPLEQRDTDGDGIGNATDRDDDGDNVADEQDAFPLIASEWRDTDNDNYGDNFDQDDDNDGVPDSLDRFPFIATEQLDTDNDGTGNNTDLDDDNDGFDDALDAFPLIRSERLDTDNDGIGNNFDLDDDNDGAPDSIDAFPTNAAEQLDTDSDGIGDNADTDDDGDGLDDAIDPLPLSQTNAQDLDGDGFVDDIDDDNDNDGVHDALDSFPNDGTETSDNDKDGIGDNADTDDDNDGTLDVDDALPLNPAETSDIDGDGIGDNADNDSDNDGVEDVIDAFPLDENETIDTDGDGTGNNADLDDDEDGTNDTEDAFPLNPFETTDSDGDGIGDNSDFDRDNDGTDDIWDAFPDDPTETLDTDNDGIGNNLDPDDDNDNTLDEDDPYPLEAYYDADTDNDGVLDQWDFDDDNDGISDFEDALPKDPTENVDTDADGIGNNADTDDDNDGVLDTEDAAPLNSNCSTVADSVGGLCLAEFMQDINFVEQLGDSIYLFNADALGSLQMQLSTEQLLPVVDLSAHATAGDTITAVEYLPSHNRVYVGFSSGVIVYFDNNSSAGTYFHTLPDGVDHFANAGNFLLAQGTGYNDTTYVLDSNGIQVSSSSTFDSIEHTAWDGTDQVYFRYWTGPPTSRRVDQTTGVISSTNIFTSNVLFLPGPLKFSPDASLLLTASGNTYFVDDNSSGGIISSEFLHDFDWNDSGELVAIIASGNDTKVEHYTTDYTVAESVSFTGTPISLLKSNDTFYVVTQSSDGVSINAYLPSPDSDNDLVLNTADAFPTDTAASIDTDGDGSPDSWNIGYTQADSTSGLVLDAYPSDPACYLNSDGNGEHCFYDLLIPVTAPTTVISEGNLTYLQYEDENLVFIRDNATDTYLTPLYVGEDDGTQILPPATMALHPEHNRLYFGYASGNVTYIDLNSNQTNEQYFVTLAESVRSITNAGQFVMFIDNSGAWVTHHYYDINGNLTQSEDWNRYSKHFAWNDSNNRLYFFRDETSPNDIHYEEISPDGMILSDGESPYHGDYSIAGPIVVSPDQTTILIGAGEYYDATTLDRIGSISRSFEHAVYLDDGRLAVLVNNGSDSTMYLYSTGYAPMAGTHNYQGEEPLGLSYYNNTLTIISYSLFGGLHFWDISNP